MRTLAAVEPSPNQATPNGHACRASAMRPPRTTIAMSSQAQPHPRHVTDETTCSVIGERCLDDSKGPEVHDRVITRCDLERHQAGSCGDHLAGAQRDAETRKLVDEP